MVSIIVPVYNINKYLPACVRSLLAQTCRDIEILLVNDGSTDGSDKLCNSLAASDPRIRAIHKENGGLSDARNFGIDRAKGDWLLFVDGDDYLAPDAVQRLLALAEPDVDFVQFLYQETGDTNWLPDPMQPANPITCTTVRQFFDRLYDMGGVAASACTKLWNRRVFQDIRFRKGILHEDEELMTRVLPGCKKIVYTDLLLYGYVIRGGSIVHSAFRPKYMDIFPIMEARIDTLEVLGFDDLILQTRKRLFTTALYRFCDAKKGGFHEEARLLKQRFRPLCREKGLPLDRRFRLLRAMTRVFPATPELYYHARKLCGKL